jgi:predicted double-glycine peptidase
MKEEELKFEEIEDSHTLGGYRRCRYYSPVRYTIVNRSWRIFSHQGKGLVPKKTHGPVYIRE